MENDKNNKIVLMAEGYLRDKEAREMLQVLSSKLDRVNERTKKQTFEIRELKKQLKAKSI